MLKRKMRLTIAVLASVLALVVGAIVVPEVAQAATVTSTTTTTNVPMCQLKYTIPPSQTVQTMYVEQTITWHRGSLNSANDVHRLNTLNVRTIDPLGHSIPALNHVDFTLYANHVRKAIGSGYFPEGGPRVGPGGGWPNPAISGPMYSGMLTDPAPDGMAASQWQFRKYRIEERLSAYVSIKNAHFVNGSWASGYPLWMGFCTQVDESPWWDGTIL